MKRNMLVAVLALVLVAPHVQATTVGVWEFWGAAPFARTPEEGCKKADKAIDGVPSSKLSDALKAEFKKQVAADCMSHTAGVWLPPDFKLDWMWSGPDKEHKTDHLKLDQTVKLWPITKGPGGQQFPPNKQVALTVFALHWSATIDGKTCHLFKPFCENWSGVCGQLPPTMTATPLAPTQNVKYRRVRINAFKDDDKGIWAEKYRIADVEWKAALVKGEADPEKDAYTQVFAALAQQPILAGERNSRPRDAEFIVMFLKKSPVLWVSRGDSEKQVTPKYFAFLREFNEPPADNLVGIGKVSTGKRGYIRIVLPPLEGISSIVFRPYDPRIEFVTTPIKAAAHELKDMETGNVWFAEKKDE